MRIKISNTDREIYYDDILNVACNSANKITSTLHLNDEQYLEVYHALIAVLDKVCGNPGLRNDITTNN